MYIKLGFNDNNDVNIYSHESVTMKIEFKLIKQALSCVDLIPYGFVL